MLGLSDAAEIAEINALRLEYPQIEAAIQDFEKSIEKHALQTAKQTAQLAVRRHLSLQSRSLAAHGHQRRACRQPLMQP